MKFLYSCIVATFFTLSAFAQDPGSAMPNTIFYNKDNTPFSTYSIPKGKQSFIIFFDASCSHCQKVVSEISKRGKELAKTNLYFVSQDDYASIDYFMNGFAKPLVGQKNVKVVQDRDHVFIMAFHPKQYPAMYLYGADKKLKLYSSSEKDVNKFCKLINP